ncbi:MAG: adenylate cyclase, partial [Chloroflexota bacterium]
KLRPVVPQELPASLRSLSGFGVEVDAMPGGFVCSGSLSQPVTRVEASDVLRGEAPIRKLFSKAQRAFYAEHAPSGIDLDSLTILGPIFVLKRKWVPKGQKRAMVAEVWIYPDGSMLLELSTKTVPDQAFKVAAETREFLTGRGISLSGAQETKTRKALDFFSARARALARASA